MNKHIHTLPDGTQATRNSKGRVYTHVIIGRRNLVAERAAASTDATRAQYRKDFGFFRQYAETPVGESWNGKSWCTTNADDQEKYAAIIATHGTADAYADARVRGSMERIGADEAGKWEVLQWSMSEANANKAVGQHKFFRDVQVQAVADYPQPAARPLPAYRRINLGHIAA